MNKLFLIAVISIFASYSTFGQLSKEEEKQLKKEIKSLTPVQYKQMQEDLDAARSEASEMKGEVNDLNSQVGSLKSENAQLKTEVADYKAAAEAAVQAQQERQTVAGDVEESSQEDNYDQYQERGPKGVIFKVQIGAFKNFDIRKYFGNHKNFSGEVDSDGTMKYTLGIFSDYWEADKFKKYLREMGVKGAWIVSYKNGKRVPIKDVLEGVI